MSTPNAALRTADAAAPLHADAMPDLPAPANAARAPEGFYTPAE